MADQAPINPNVHHSLSDELLQSMSSRYVEVYEELLQTSNAAGRTEEFLASWQEQFFFYLQHYKHRHHQKLFPAVQGGSIARLRKIHHKIQQVRLELSNLDDRIQPPEILAHVQVNYLEPEPGDFIGKELATLQDAPFTGSVHGSLRMASINLAIHIAQVNRAQVAERRVAPKRDFIDGLYDVFETSNPNSAPDSSPTGEFAHFISLAFYVADGEEGAFPQKAVAQVLKTKNSEEKALVSESHGDESTQAGSFGDWYSRQVLDDIKWVMDNLTPKFHFDTLYLARLAESHVGRLQYPTEADLSWLQELQSR